MKIIVGTSGRINELLQGVPNAEFISAAPFGDGKVLVVVKGEVGEVVKAGEIIEVIKEVQIDNPEQLEQIGKLNQLIENQTVAILDRDGQIQTLQDALSDALNAEEAAKKVAEDLKGELKTLKGKFTKLKNKFLEEV